jgi:hypothetical protein
MGVSFSKRDGCVLQQTRLALSSSTSLQSPAPADKVPRQGLRSKVLGERISY